MKKMISLFTALCALAVLLVGCGGGDTKPSSTISTT